MRTWRHADRHPSEQAPQPKPLWNGQVAAPEPPLVKAKVLPAPAAKSAPAQPVLEVNRLPRKNLRLLIDAVGQRQVERDLDVHRTTVKRWLSGEVKIPGAQHLAIRYLLGDLPGTQGEWTGWRFAFGELVTPGGDRFTPGDVQAIRLQQQRARVLDQELREMRLRIKVLEKTLNQAGVAANEEQARG